MIGKNISHYKILEKLGEGGMGEVYKAEDTKLKRTVALKFLPHGLEAQEPERARFLQEAQAAATLNHPNICTVHDISEYQGQQFIVMEFVDGRTLKQMVPVQRTQDALDYAVQIGEALQEAHGHGVFHRDVKTANIMVNARNRIKVMDFGLAKLKGSLKLTRTSSTMGTLPYMAPEQLTGGQADARSDIFSFGVVFYEMLTGRLPFPGDYEAAVIYSILNEAPVPVAKFRAELSSELLHIIDRALEKDPDDRYQAMQEMVIDLKRAKKESARVSWSPIAQPAGEQRQETVSRQPGTTAPARKKRGRRTLRIAGIIGASVAAAAIALLTVRPSRAPQLNPAMTFRVLPMPSPEIGTPGLSRDGNWAAFPAEDTDSKYNIYYANTASGKSRRVTSDASKYMIGADISPDGSWIVYDRFDAARGKWEIAVVSPVGDAGRKVIDEGVFPRWRADGQRIGYVRGKNRGSRSGKAEFWTVRPNGSENRRERVDPAADKTMEFAWSPDGRSICWIRCLTEDRSELFIHELSSGKERQLTFDNKNITGVCWAANGQVIFSSNRSGNYNLWMVPASGGAPVQITRGAGPDYAATISHDGSKLLCYQMQQLGNIWIAGTDGSHPRQITFGDSFFWRVAFSPDGKGIVSGYFQPAAPENGAFVCAMDREGGNRKELTYGEESINNPLPSPDGRWIVYGRHSRASSTESSMVYLIDAQNPGAPRPVGKGAPYRWLNEKSFISYDDSSKSTWLNHIDGEKPQKFFLESTFAFPLQGGRYIAYYDFRSGHEGRWITAAPGVKDPDLPSARELLSPYYGEFDKPGEFFYYVRNAGELRRVSIPSGKEEAIPAVFPGLNPEFYHSSFDISYDGKEIVYTDSRYNSKLVMIENPFK